MSKSQFWQISTFWHIWIFAPKFKNIENLSFVKITLRTKNGLSEQCGIVFFELYFFIRITDESEIPQGTLVFPNLSWIMHDENHFKTPETFDPQRFLHQELLKKNFVFSVWWTSDSIFYRETKLFRTEDHIVWKLLKMS